MANLSNIILEPIHTTSSSSAQVAPQATGSEHATEVFRKVVAFAADDDSAAALRTGLQTLGEDLEGRRGNLTPAVRDFERESAVRAAIVDISGIAEPQAALDDLARVCPAAVKVIVIGENTEIGFYRHLVGDLGVAEYLPKPLNRDAVQRVLLPTLSGAAVDTSSYRGSHVIAVCGARGGAGATTIAVSLALRLAEETKGHVALLDLHLQDGNTAGMLSQTPGPGLRIALEEPGRVDALFLDRTAIVISNRLRLIAADGGFDSAPLAKESGLSQVLDLMRQRFNFIVIDLPMPPQRGMQKVLEIAREVVVVMAPDVVSLRDALAIRALATKAAGSDRVMTVVNRCDLKGGLPRELLAKGLGREPDVMIPDLGRQMLQAANLGIPAVERVPALGRALGRLVQELGGTKGKRHRGLIDRMLGR